MSEQGYKPSGRPRRTRLTTVAFAAMLAAVALVPAAAQSTSKSAAGSQDARVQPLRGENASRQPIASASRPHATREVTYRVRGDRLRGKKVKPAHRKIWRRFIALIPTDERRHLRKFAVFRGSFASAYVNPLRDPTKWKLGVWVGLKGSRDLDYVLIHEFGHLLTLKASQVPPGGSKQNCTTYFPGEGCALSQSYLAKYVYEYWQSTGRLAEWNKARKGGNRALNKFYEKYRDEFVTSYGVSHPAEDIAESFAAFTVANSPTGPTVAAQKRRFFERFPELVELREEIRLANPNPKILK